MKRENVPGTIYLLHFSAPYYRARHYLGWTERPVEDRVAEHLKGIASPLVKAAVAAGITVTLVRTWEHVDRFEERRMKNRKNISPHCPTCRDERAS